MSRGRFLSNPLPNVPLVRAVGNVVSAEVEQHANPDEVDHIWITIDIGIAEQIWVSVNTLSKFNRLAGFDSRVRVGIVRGIWDYLPPRGAAACPNFDYEKIETTANVFFEYYERSAMEKLLLDRCAQARLIEVWGVPYRGSRHGIHQIHSRRASCAVADDVIGQDGALKFYFDQDRATELILLKFCGQP